MSFEECEERRRKILANAELRLAKIRQINRSENLDNISSMAPISSLAPDDLLRKSNEQIVSSIDSNVYDNQLEQTSLFSTFLSAINMFSPFTTSSPSSSKVTTENTKEMVEIDKQHILMFILGILVELIYDFYISAK